MQEAAFAPAVPELADDDAGVAWPDVLPPDEPQPATVAAAAARHATVRPRRPLTLSVIISMPFVSTSPALRNALVADGPRLIELVTSVEDIAPGKSLSKLGAPRR